MDSTASIYTPKNTFVSSFTSYLFDLLYIQKHNIVAASSSDQMIKLYDSSRFQLQREFSAHSGPITDLQYSTFHPDQLFSGSSDRTIKGFDLRSGSVSCQVQCKYLLFMIKYIINNHQY